MSGDKIKTIFIIIMFLVIGGQMVINNKVVATNMLKSGGLFNKKVVTESDIAHEKLKQGRFFVFFAGIVFVLFALVMTFNLLK